MKRPRKRKKHSHPRRVVKSYYRNYRNAIEAAGGSALPMPVWACIEVEQRPHTPLAQKLAPYVSYLLRQDDREERIEEKK